MSTAQRCAETVHHGRMGFFACSNDALPGDTLCGTHRAAAERRKSAPKQQAATAAPVLEVTRTTTVTMSWATGTGPVFRAPYETRDTVWSWLRVSREGSDVQVGGRGYVLRKDGTPGQQTVDLRFAGFTHLPAELQVAFEDALTEADR